MKDNTFLTLTSRIWHSAPYNSNRMVSCVSLDIHQSRCRMRKGITTCKELLGIVYGLKKYRHHLLGQPIVVHTDHVALTFLMKMPEPVGQGRWLDLLSEYDITNLRSSIIQAGFTETVMHSCNGLANAAEVQTVGNAGGLSLALQPHRLSVL